MKYPFHKLWCVQDKKFLIYREYTFEAEDYDTVLEMVPLSHRLQSPTHRCMLFSGASNSAQLEP